MKKRVLLSAGGTGGHLFPAQILAQTLSECEILFTAGGLATNRYFNRDQFFFKEVESATFSMRKPLQVLKGCSKICRGIFQSRKVIRHFSPDLVVGFGSFFTLPVLIAAWMENIPIILHEQNTIPGKVNRLFSSYAHLTAITFPSTRNLLKGNGCNRAVEVIFPLRKKMPVTREEAWNYFGLTPFKPTVLIFGGSQGASFLNDLFLETIELLPDVQILHFTGNEAKTDEARKKYAALQRKACVKEFEPYMERAMYIADCAIVRAGASTLAELIEFDLPAVLVPYPYATENHQEKNGMHFVSIVKGGKMYKESELDAELLAKGIGELILNLKTLKKNIVDYKTLRTNTHLEDVIRGFLKEGSYE